MVKSQIDIYPKYRLFNYNTNIQLHTIEVQKLPELMPVSWYRYVIIISIPHIWVKWIHARSGVGTTYFPQRVKHQQAARVARVRNSQSDHRAPCVFVRLFVFISRANEAAKTKPMPVHGDIMSPNLKVFSIFSWKYQEIMWKTQFA